MRVGEWFYLVNSSFEMFPGVPIHRSRDLVSWEPLGHVLTRDSQLPLATAGPSRGIFAPTIRYHAGTYYMITTNVSHRGSFFVTAKDPAGPWSEPIWIAGHQGGIDPSLFFDDDGKVYLTSTAARRASTSRRSTSRRASCSPAAAVGVEGDGRPLPGGAAPLQDRRAIRNGDPERVPKPPRDGLRSAKPSFRPRATTC